MGLYQKKVFETAPQYKEGIDEKARIKHFRTDEKTK